MTHEDRSQGSEPHALRSVPYLFYSLRIMLRDPPIRGGFPDPNSFSVNDPLSVPSLLEHLIRLWHKTSIRVKARKESG